MAATNPSPRVLPPARIKNTFNAIKSFVDELYEGFKDGETKTSPLVLYWRLLTLIHQQNNVAAKTFVVNGFDTFFQSFDTAIVSGKLGEIPEGTHIDYPNKKGIYIDIYKFLRPSDDDVHIIVRQHLMTISAILNPDEKKLKAIEKSEKSNTVLAIPNDGSEESKFLTDIMDRAKESMRDAEFDAENPTGTVMGMLQSGVVTDMFTGIQEGIGSGRFRYRKMARLMQGLIGSFIPEGEDDDEEDE